MPYADPVVKKEKAALYRQKNRAILAEKERIRRRDQRANMNDEDRAKFKAQKSESLRLRKSSGRFDRAKSRAASMVIYEKKKNDPEFRKKATERMRKWAIENRDKFNKTLRAIRARRMATDICYKLSASIRRRFYMALKGNNKGSSSIESLGCSLEEFKAFMESKFQQGMSWSNWARDGWHIDHIKPLAKFNLTDPAQVSEACHYTNLQPLWAVDNIRKHCR